MMQFATITLTLLISPASVWAEWGSPRASKIDTLREAVATAWEQEPLTVRRAVFITGESSGFGLYIERVQITRARAGRRQWQR